MAGSVQEINRLKNVLLGTSLRHKARNITVQTALPGLTSGITTKGRRSLGASQNTSELVNVRKVVGRSVGRGNVKKNREGREGWAGRVRRTEGGDGWEKVRRRRRRRGSGGGGRCGGRVPGRNLRGCSNHPTPNTVFIPR